MRAVDWLWMVFTLLPAAFFLDLLVLPFAIWWWRRWKRARTQKAHS